MGRNIEEIKKQMDELTPDKFIVKGGDFAQYTVNLDEGKVYAQAVARILHANAEHAAHNCKYDIKIVEIKMIEQLIEDKKVPVAIVIVEVDSPLYGKMQNAMTAILDTTQSSNPIAAMHPIETAITQAVGRCLGMYGFAFTGSMVTADEMFEGKNRQSSYEEKRNLSPLDQLKKEVINSNQSWQDFISTCGYEESDLFNNRAIVIRLLNDFRKR